MNKQHKWHKEIKAWAEGQEIEVSYFNTSLNKWDDWRNMTASYWHDTDDVKYRIKSQPKLIPFDFSDADKIIGKPIKRKDGSDYFIIISVGSSTVSVSGSTFYYEKLLTAFQFLDGSPCGKYVNE